MKKPFSFFVAASVLVSTLLFSTNAFAAKLSLPASAPSWTVYKLGHPLVKSNPSNVAGQLSPSRFGGLTYDILGNPSPYVYLIQTQSFGEVEIYGAPSTGATIIGGTQVSPSPTKPAPISVPTQTPATSTTTYTVQKGDTLFGISLKFKTSVTALKTLNGLSTNTIYVGQKLKISGNAPSTPVASLPLSGKVIVLDPGHGGSDTGAIAIDGSYEKSHNLSYATDVKSDLEALGATVYMTRTSDLRCGNVYNEATYTDLQCRVDLASQKNANIYVSIHMNSGGNATGSTTYYNSTNDYDGNMNPFPVQSKSLATYIQNNYQPVIGLANRGVLNSDYYVNRMAKVPSVLLEVGFLSNSYDLSRINSTEQVTTKAIANGILQYLQNN